ncbi:DUF397 domain-containing protein [Streptomyces sp. NPDC101151]|uniref:DUF397 domain-containing protein n=1 Tax=Streptomyces sp. NPDC101151 TaxID=3366115 RepID=UPI003812D8FB
MGTATWHKSSYSGGTGGECLEVADLKPHIAIRDSKNQHGPALLFPAGAWSVFVESVKH